jgi:UDP-2,3-diacylglucosamine pyrophosphatase LpxH
MGEHRGMQINEPIRIISDLHLGMSSSALENAGQLLPLLRDNASVIFNGDSVEIHFAKRREEGMRNAAELREICAQAGTAPFFLNGNHDPNISENSHADLADGAVLVTHGDMLFHTIAPWGASEDADIMGRVHTEALAELEDDALLDFEKRLHASKRAALAIEMHDVPLPRGPLANAAFFLRIIWPPWRTFQILKCWRQAPGRAAKLAEIFRPRARIIIIGHTHRAGIWRIGPRIVINTGSFMMFAKRYVVDVQNNVVSVKQIKAGKGGFAAGKEIARFDATRL